MKHNQKEINKFIEKPSNEEYLKEVQQSEFR